MGRGYAVKKPGLLLQSQMETEAGRPRQPPLACQIPEVTERQPLRLPVADQAGNVREMEHLR